MLKTGQTLLSPVDFDNAMFFAIPVTVWQQDMLIDYGGCIQRHTEDAVYIDDGAYLKALCQFKVR